MGLRAPTIVNRDTEPGGAGSGLEILKLREFPLKLDTVVAGVRDAAGVARSRRTPRGCGSVSARAAVAFDAVYVGACV